MRPPKLEVLVLKSGMSGDGWQDQHVSRLSSSDSAGTLGRNVFNCQ